MPLPHPASTSENSAAFLQGGGEMGALIRNYDWESHPLGSPETWPENLKTMVRMILNSGFPMFLWWTDNLYMFHNDAYLPALGNKHPQALGTSAKVMWAEIWEQIGIIAEDILANGNQFYAEELYLVLERKGFPEETYWTFSYSPAFNDNGKVYGIFCACTEVTNSVINQRRLRTLKDISDATVLIQTLEQACQTASDILSNSPQDIPFNLIYLLNAAGNEATLLGRSGDLYNINPPVTIRLDEDTPACAFTTVLKTKELVVFDPADAQLAVEEIAPGFSIPAKAAILPIFRPGQDNVTGFCVAGISYKLEFDADYIGFLQLVVRQFATSMASVLSRLEAIRQQEYLKDIFQQAPVGITILRGPDYIVDLANPGVCEIWGRKQEDVLGMPVLEAIPEVKDQGVRELLDGVYYTGVPFVADELPVMLERGGKLQEVFLNFVYHPMYDVHGAIMGVIAVAIDITEQVNTRLQIEQMNRELLATNADLDNFVYSASHDLKAPISNIEGLVKELINYLPATDAETGDVQYLFKLIQNSIDRFKRAIADLTEVAKIQRENTEDVVSVNLTDVVEDVKLDFETLIREKDAEIQLQLDLDATIEFSAKNVRSIVYNLLSNALKYSSPVRKPVIRITSETTPEYVILSVADNGLGLKPEDESKIFTMFKRLHDHVEGTGVGLYIVKRIVENAGGHIEVESKVGNGSTFKVYFKR